MGAFEVHNTPQLAGKPPQVEVKKEATGKELHAAKTGDTRHVKDEWVIAHKVYDSCRRQNCLTYKELGPARIVDHGHGVPEGFSEGGIIRPMCDAATVAMENVRIKEIQVVDKQPSPFRNGFWDVNIKYVFEYVLTFREAGGRILGSVDATSVFNMKAALYGSVGADLVIGTDFGTGAGETFAAAPFIWVEAKAVGLDAKIHRHNGYQDVHVTIGLFSILKLFRMVHLNVQSKGFCMPDECHDQGDINPCEYFAELDFPIDIFAPPQRKAIKCEKVGTEPF